MKRSLLIVGAGGFARETVRAVDAINAVDDSWNLLGFLDDDPALHGSLVSGTPVVGPVEAVADHVEAAVVVCTGRPDNYLSRRRIVQRLGLPLERFATVVHPSCILAADTVVGRGSVLLAGVITTASVQIGSHVAVMPQCVLTHDDTIGDFATLASGVRLGGGVTIETGAYLGAGSLVGESTTIGRWSLVGMGAVVRHDIAAKEVWAGVPARRLRAADIPEDW